MTAERSFLVFPPGTKGGILCVSIFVFYLIFFPEDGGLPFSLISFNSSFSLVFFFVRKVLYVAQCRQSCQSCFSTETSAMNVKAQSSSQMV